MTELEIVEAITVAVIVATIAFVVWRKRNFVLVTTLGLFVIVGLEFLFHPRPPNSAEICTFPGLSWQFGLWDQPLEWYRIVTSLFLHDACKAEHIVGNAFILVLLGWPLEQKIGWKLTMIIFFLTGIVGEVFSTALYLVSGDTLWMNANILGASGSIFGIIAYFAVRYPQEKVWAPLIIIIARVPIAIAAIFALIVQALILLQINSPFIGQLPWPSIMAHLMSFGVGMIATKIPGLQADESPNAPAFHLDLSPLRDLAVKPADKMEAEAIVAEDIPEVAQVKLEAFVKRAPCPQCGGPLVLKGRKMESDCGWSVSFERRKSEKSR